MQKRDGVQGLLLEEVVSELELEGLQEEPWGGERRFLAEGLHLHACKPSPGLGISVVPGADGQEVRLGSAPMSESPSAQRVGESSLAMTSAAVGRQWRWGAHLVCQALHSPVCV